MSVETIRVVWRGGHQADVSRELYDWIAAHVPEAATPEARADLYEVGVKLSRMLSAVGDAKASTDQMRVAERNAASARVVEAWDQLMASLVSHPTYNGDHHAACERAGVDRESAARYAEVLRGVIAGYRVPAKLPKGGRAERLRNQWLAEFTEEVMRAIGIEHEARAATIISGIVNLAGLEANAASLRQKVRNRRVKKG